MITTDKKKIKVLIVFMLLLLITGCSADRNQGEAENDVSDREVSENQTEDQTADQPEDQPNPLLENQTADQPEDQPDPVLEDIPDAEITEEEIHNLLAENYFCITNIFMYGNLNFDESRRQGYIAPVADERFTSYDDLENYLKSIYVDEEVDNLLMKESPYFEQQDEIWMRTDKETEEMPAEWTSYQEGYIIEEAEVEGNQGKIVIRLDNPENEEREYKLIFRATYEDGWRLNKMISQAALFGYVKQGEHFTYKIWEVGGEDIVWGHRIFVYDGENLVQVIGIESYDPDSLLSGYNRMEAIIWEVDVNFDGTLDLMLFCGHTGNQYAAMYDCYVFDEGQFFECETFMNPSIDEENQLIITYSRGSAASYEETAYTVEGIDSKWVWKKEYVYDDAVGDYVIQSEYYY